MFIEIQWGSCYLKNWGKFNTRKYLPHIVGKARPRCCFRRGIIILTTKKVVRPTLYIRLPPICSYNVLICIFVSDSIASAPTMFGAVVVLSRSGAGICFKTYAVYGLKRKMGMSACVCIRGSANDSFRSLHEFNFLRLPADYKYLPSAKQMITFFAISKWLLKSKSTQNHYKILPQKGQNGW